MAGGFLVAIVVVLIAKGSSAEIQTVVALVAYTVILGIMTIAGAAALPCKIVVDRFEVTFIRRFGRRRTFRWDQIWGFEVVNDLKTSRGYVIGVDGQRFQPTALLCCKFGLGAPASLRYTCDLLNYELHLRRSNALPGSAATAA